jgi:anti-sigma-K factor RskA
LNISDYISSGIIESYVLGLADAAEQQELEQLRIQYPELEAAIRAFEQSLEQNALAAATPPPAHLKEKILSALVQEAGESRAIPLPVYNIPPASVKPMSWFRYAAAASLVGLLASAILNFYLLNQNKALTETQVKLTASVEKNQQQLADMQNYLAMVTDTAMYKVVMKGLQSKDEMATIYWDTRTKDVYLDVKNMAKPADDQQYQLWAIVDGKPVDAGVFELKENKMQLSKMKNIQRAEMFAVTLEKKGGSPTPKGTMTVAGKV